MVIRGKVGNSQHFPTNLHILLDEAEKADHGHIVSWCAQGQSFKIHDQDALVPLLAKYFRQTKFKSFLRQLQSYGFHRTTRGVDKGVVSHPYFVRGRRSLCFRMTRKPTGAAAEAMTRQLANSAESLSRVLPSNAIMPLRKTQSAPMGFQTAFTDVSKLKNAAFNFSQGNSLGEIGSNHLQKMNSYQMGKIASSFKPLERRRSSSTSAMLYSSKPAKTDTIRRASDPAIRLSSQQREGLLKCAEIDYRSGSPIGERLSPQSGFLLSIKESTSTPNQVPSSQQQQISFQVQPEHHQEPLPLHAVSHQDQLQQQQVIQVQRTTGPQNNNQVHIQQLQYHQQQAQAPQHQVCVQYRTEQEHGQYPQHVTYTQYEVEPPQLRPVQEAQPQEAPQVDKVYSHQEVAEKIKQAKEDMEKHFREQMYRHQEQRGLQQVCYHGMQNQPLVQQHKNQPSQQYHQVPPPKSCDPPSLTHKTSAMYASVPSNNFELSFSTSEFSNGTPMSSVAEASKNVPSSGEGSSFSVAISTPTLGRLPPPTGMVNAMPPTPRVPMNCYSKSGELRPINIHNMQATHHSQQQEQQQQQHVESPERPEPIQLTSAPVEPTHCDSIDEGTVDFLLQTGSGGCDEWDMPADEVAEGLDYYGFLNTPGDVSTEVSSTESCSTHHQQEHVPIHHHSNPVPVVNARQYSRQ